MDVLREPPELLRVTGSQLHSLVRQGWTFTEHRSAGWLYLVARGQGQAVVYKLIGPRFDDGGAHYLGHRMDTPAARHDRPGPARDPLPDRCHQHHNSREIDHAART